MDRPLVTIAIPAYNRAAYLPQLLASVLAQPGDDWECVVAEDGSPERPAIREVVVALQQQHPGRIRYIEHPENRGYDANLRSLIAEARGRYVLFLGNDDYLAPTAVASVRRAHALAPDFGVLLRAYHSFRGTPDHIVDTTRYYATERVFPAGVSATLACFRRLEVISGLTFHRDLAHAAATDQFDGHGYYQCWLGARLLRERPAVSLPDVIVHFRRGGVPDFGTAPSERGKFVPGSQPPSAHVWMQRAKLEIARAAVPELADAIERDFAVYSLGVLANEASMSRAEFRRFAQEVADTGLGRHWQFHAWLWAVRLLGGRRLLQLNTTAKRMLGRLPELNGAVR